jgi:long-chain acyl-CoA synthetase
VLKPGSTLTVPELQAHVAERLAMFKVPTLVTFSTERLARSATGKILKRELRSSLYPDQEHPGSEVPAS